MDRTTPAHFEDLLQGCTSALAGPDPAKLTFGPEERWFSPLVARLTRRPAEMSARQRAVLRGQADLVALYARWHNAEIQNRLIADVEQSAAIVAEAEQVRVECVGSAAFPGIAANLAVMLEDRYLQAERLIDVEDSVARLGLAIAAILREQLAAPRPSRAFALVETWRGYVQPFLQSRAGRLRAALTDQRAFGRIVLEIAATMPVLSPALMGRSVAPPVTPKLKDDQDFQGSQDDMRASGEASGTKAVSEEATGSEPLFGAADSTDTAEMDTNAEARNLRQDDGTAQPMRRTLSRAQKRPGEYRVFTRGYDETITARALLARLDPLPGPAEPDDELIDLRRIIGRLAARLEARLLAVQPAGWEREVEEGLLDPKRLARAVASPTSRLFFMRRRPEPFRDTAVTLLLDNSASMRGQPLRIVALCVEILARVLMRVGVRTEVLGFTTRSWRGGRARQDWLAAGSPPGPGRLNELQHIIYKPADAGIRQLSRDLRLMTLRALPKENIDAEALEWAHARLLRRPEQRRILIIISDGAPSDEATLAVSDSTGNMLENHLRQITAEIDRHSPVELLAIGIGYDVANLYPNAVRIADTAALSEVLMTQLYDRLRAPGQARRVAVRAA